MDEYLALAVPVRALAPCNFLVFGVGRDSLAWARTNAAGRTVFLEGDDEWRAAVESEVPGIDVRSVRYTVPFEDWQAGGCRRVRRLAVRLDADVATVPWDAVFIDAPFGPTVGRHQSAYTAAKLVAPGGVVAIHDCDRLREQVICQHLLEAAGLELFHDVGRLRIYKAPH